MLRVFVEEEYGYRYWWWFPPLTWTWVELVQWWEGLASVEDAFNWTPDCKALTLPGRVVQLDVLPDAVHGWYVHIHQDPDSYLVAPPLVGRQEDGMYFHAGFCDWPEPDESAPVIGHFTVEPNDPRIVGDPLPRITGFVPVKDDPEIVL